MKNVVIVSFGQEVARVSYDTRGGQYKAISFDPMAGESNKSNCLSVLVHSIEQLKNAGVTETSNIYTLSMVANSVGKLFNTKKTLAMVDVKEADKILEVFLEGSNATEQEREMWTNFIELNESMPNIRIKGIPNKETTEKMSKSTSGFDRNLAKAIMTAWDRLPQIEFADEAIEDEAI